MAGKKYRVALLLTKSMAASILSAEDYGFLHSFADTNPIDELPEKLTDEFMENALKDADACMTCWGTPNLSEAVLASANKLRLIAHAAGSVKSLVPPSFWQSGRRITSNAPVIAEDVAQTVLAYVLFAVRGLWDFARITKEGKWGGGETSFVKTRRLNGLKVGIVGASNVGRETIKALAPFGCEIVLYDPYISPIEARRLHVTQSGLDELLSSCDVISLHAPATAECRHMINGDNIRLIKDGALFINSARGALVDEAALIGGLEKGRFFACIDVTDPEPPAADHPFRKMDNVILTPHTAGGHTSNGRLELGANAVNEIYNYLHKGLLAFEVRREMLENMA